MEYYFIQRTQRPAARFTASAALLSSAFLFITFQHFKSTPFIPRPYEPSNSSLLSEPIYVTIPARLLHDRSGLIYACLLSPILVVIISNYTGIIIVIVISWDIFLYAIVFIPGSFRAIVSCTARPPFLPCVGGTGKTHSRA